MLRLPPGSSQRGLGEGLEGWEAADKKGRSRPSVRLLCREERGANSVAGRWLQGGTLHTALERRGRGVLSEQAGLSPAEEMVLRLRLEVPEPAGVALWLQKELDVEAVGPSACPGW